MHLFISKTTFVTNELLQINFNCPGGGGDKLFHYGEGEFVFVQKTACLLRQSDFFLTPPSHSDRKQVDLIRHLSQMKKQESEE